MNSSLTPFFNAKGVAILGASTNPKKLSYGILDNLVSHGYKGEIYPINPNASEILGLKVFASISEVPDPVELAVVVLPATMIMETISQIGERGIKNVVIITGGFKELGKDGAKLEKELKKLSDSYEMRVIGPNCVGTMDMYTGLNSTFIKGMPNKGPIGFISQSGAICGGVVDLVIDSQIGFSHFASLGNEMDVDETDMIEYFGEDDHVKVIALYVEGIKNGARFIEVSREVSKKKPILFLKAGKNDAGAKAVSSHTGSLAGSYTAYQAALEQAGIIEVTSISELFNTAWALGTQPLPKGNKVAITTNAGGAAALAADGLAFNGFELAYISIEIQEKLRTKLNPSAQVSNPVDMLGSVTPEDYIWSLENLNQDNGVDVLLPILVPQALVDTASVARAWSQINTITNKPLLTCLMGRHSTAEAEALLNQNGVPVFAYPEQIGPTLKGMNKYQEILDRGPFQPIRLEDIDQNKIKNVLDNVGELKVLGEHQTRQILEAYGIKNVPGNLAKSLEEALEIASAVTYPVVLKIAADKILHKSDAGGIKLNIGNEDQLRVVYKELVEKITIDQPEIIISGVMVEHMAQKGTEVIVGMKRDVTFGPVIMFGMGGVWVELMKDIAFKVAPISKKDIQDMLDQTIAGKILKGYRGSDVGDLSSLSDVIARLSQLSLDFPMIDEIEINPLIVYKAKRGVIALDSRAILK